MTVTQTFATAQLRVAVRYISPDFMAWHCSRAHEDLNLTNALHDNGCDVQTSFCRQA